MRPIPFALSLAVLAALVVTISPAPAAAQAASHIRLENPWARRAPTGGAHGHANGAVYVTIRNDGTEGDALVSAASDAATAVELHETVTEDGVMKMRPLSRFDVPAAGAVEMKPGGHHIMLLGLTRDLKPGDRVTVTLRFEKAGPMSVEASVK
jgi:copper(I)-binding protein